MTISSATDNLYKFCAVSGVVICLFSLYVPYRFADELSQRVAPLQVSTRRSEIEANHLFQEAEKLSNALEGKPEAEGKPAPTMSASEKLAGLKTLNASRLQLNIKYAEIKAANLELARANHLSTGITIVGLALFITGGLLIRYGLLNWYDRVQAVRDLALQRELDKLAQEKIAKK